MVVNSVVKPTNESDCSSHECEQESDSCFVHIADQTVRKGCLKESIESVFLEKGINLIDDCKDKNTCQLCSDHDNCNNINIDVETCVDCHTETNLNCSYVPDEKMTRTCQLSFEPMGCYLLKPGLTNVKRGCMSELDEDDREICLKEDTKCKTCIGDNCNLEIQFQSCHVCDSSVDGEKCLNQVREINTKLCKNPLSDCFINIDNNNIVSRGCLSEDLPEESCKSGKCKTCSNWTDCNSENITPEVCITCDSMTDSDCKTNATLFANRACPLSFVPEWCYHHIGDNGHHIRGMILEIPHGFKHNKSFN